MHLCISFSTLTFGYQPNLLLSLDGSEMTISGSPTLNKFKSTSIKSLQSSPSSENVISTNF